MSQNKLPPHIKKTDHVILFDGECKLCNASINFIIDKDPDGYFKFCHVQSKQGKEILAYFNFPTDFYETVLYVKAHIFYDKSDAFFEIVKTLKFPWRAISIFYVLPKFLRDWLYDRVALNRYRFFGKYNICLLPNSELNKRFINGK